MSPSDYAAEESNILANGLIEKIGSDRAITVKGKEHIENYDV